LDASTPEVVRHAKRRYGVVVRSIDVSQLRSHERAKLRKSKEGQPEIPGMVKPGSRPREATTSPAAVNAAEVILTVKDAARRVGGMEQLKAIIQALEH
jgi:hypothetical protein